MLETSKDEMEVASS